MIRFHFPESARRKLLWLAALPVTLFWLWLIRIQPLSAFAHAIHDSALYCRQAEFLLAGHWLGPYDNLTLVKEMFYPLWIAAMHLLHVPLLWSHHLLYASACLAFVFAVRPLLNRVWLPPALYLILLFNPMSSNDLTATVIREGIYPALTLLTLAGGIALAVRVDADAGNLLPWSLVLGLATSALWLTREESVWILPALLIVLGYVAWKRRGADWARTAVLVVLPVFLCLASVGTVGLLNWRHYGVWTTRDTNLPGYRAAYRALTGVQPAVWNPRIPLAAETRERIYASSPSFTELRPELEGALGRDWGQASALACLSTSGQSEIGGGHFFLALRDAVARRGYYVSAAAAEAYYRRVAAEVRSAAHSGRLPSGFKPSVWLPLWHAQLASHWLAACWKTARYLLSWDGCSPIPAPSIGTPEQLTAVARLTRERLAPAELRGTVVLSGWFFSPSGETTLTVRTSDGKPVPARLDRIASPDVFNHFLQSQGREYPASRQARFRLALNVSEPVFLHFDLHGRCLARIPLTGVVPALAQPDFYFFQDDFQTQAYWPLASARPLRLRWLMVVSDGYRACVPWLAALALAVVGLRFLPILRASWSSALAVTLLTLAACIATRVALIGLMHITALDAVNARFLAPVYAPLLAWMLLALTAGSPSRGR